MPTPKQLGPAQPRRNAGAGELTDDETARRRKRQRERVRRLEDPEKTPGAGVLPDGQQGKDVDPGSG